MKKFLPITISFAFLLSPTLNSNAQLIPAYDDIFIPMSDGDSLQADVYIPSSVTSAEVIFIQTPYNKDWFSLSLPMGVGLDLDTQPFIWVIVDWRGFYGSSMADVSSVDRGQDAFDACDWIIAQTWSDTRIGTWGPSALGGIQYQLINKHHPNHICAVPLVATGDQSYENYFYGGVLEEARL
ncbi:CocE/NonD family hydrolase, partial [bacterium AH-315-C20]|nr:CocE/NonD family hydrolase [bacterium AH-315-C20]